MDSVFKSNASVTPPAATEATSAGYPVNSNPGLGVAPTTIGGYWFYQVTQEILATIVAAGLVASKNTLTQLRDAIYALVRGTTQTITSTGTQNNYALTAARRLILRCNNASLVTFTGFAPATAVQDGDEVLLLSVGGGQVDITNQDTNSTIGNRVINPVTGKISLAAGSGRCLLRYDGTTLRWRVVSHDQGAYISPAYNAGDFTGGGGTWTVDAGDVTRYAYLLRGRQLSVTGFFANTTVGAGLTSMQIAIPAGYQAVGNDYGFAELRDNAAQSVGLCYTGASAIVVQKAGGGGFANVANASGCAFHHTFEVQ